MVIHYIWFHKKQQMIKELSSNIACRFYIIYVIAAQLIKCFITKIIMHYISMLLLNHQTPDN